MNERLMYKRIRNVCGFLGMILPWLALFSAGLIQNKPDASWWYSISATYYQSPALVAILTAASIVLMCYSGYELIDDLITTASGVCGLFIVLFPCSVSWLDGKVGFFQLPINISNIIHSVAAIIFFALLAVNCLFLFTKSNGIMTNRKKVRNIIYKICGIGMLVVEVWQVIKVVANLPGWWTMVNEILLLQFFGVSWLVKGEAFPFLNDRKVKK